MLENEKLRYILAGGWNTIFGWLVFAGLFQLLSPGLNLWAISALSHLIATTQAFVIQRRLVFRRKQDAVLPQFAKFQLAYLILLGIGALMVNALSVQGIDSRLAQALALAVLAVCGFVLGKSFTFNPDAINFAALVSRLRAPRALAVPAIALVASLALFELIWGARFYSSPTHIGHDFALTGLGLLEGKYWLMVNGTLGGLFNPPWFTPAWCAGAAFYADPQSAFYSPLQWLAFWVDPFLATHLNALLFAAVGFVGSFVLAKAVFGWTAHGATVFAILGIANNFLPLRSAVGEAGYQPWTLWPWLVFALCWPISPGLRSHAWPAVGVGVLLTAWLQFGFGGMIIPAVLAVLLLCCVLGLQSRAQAWIVAFRLALGGLLALLLNGSKIYESVSLLRQFPRDFYGLPGFTSLGDTLSAIALSLFAPSQWAFSFSSQTLTGMRFTALPHEWAYGFGLGSATVGVAGAVAVFLTRSKSSSTTREAGSPSALDRVLGTLGILFLLALPILLLWDAGPTRELIKTIPVLNSTTWPMRWVILYVPVLQWALALPAACLLARFPKRGNLLTAAALALVWLGPAREPLSYYSDPTLQHYSPRPVMDAYDASRSSQRPTPITRVAGDIAAGRFNNRNDTMLAGISQGICYNPIYGYRLESFPQLGRLRDGEALSVDASGQSLLLNPACLAHPKENFCTPGDGFRMDDPLQRMAAQRFLARQPFEWERSLVGRGLSLLSQATFWLMLGLVSLRFWSRLLSVANRQPSLRPRSAQ